MSEKTDNIKASFQPGSVHPDDEMIRILIVDDNKLFREGLKDLLQQEPDFIVAGGAENGEQAIELAGKRSPDVIIMDINLGETNGIDLTCQVLSKYPHIKVVGFSMHDDRHIVDAMYRAGAVGYLSKYASSEEIFIAIRNCISKK